MNAVFKLKWIYSSIVYTTKALPANN